MRAAVLGVLTIVASLSDPRGRSRAAFTQHTAFRLYRALGTIAYVLRQLYGQMVDRSFDPRRTGELWVRVFLGILSGVTLQWLVARDGLTIPGGVTPGVLAFLGGYSIELVFAAIDCLPVVVGGASRGTPASARQEPREMVSGSAGS
jgi:hypothetical protein